MQQDSTSIFLIQRRTSTSSNPPSMDQFTFWARLANPFWRPSSRKVIENKDIVLRKDPSSLLQVHTHVSIPKNVPVLLFLSDSNNVPVFCHYMVLKQWVLVNVKIPANLSKASVCVSNAMDWISGHVDQFGGDPNQVFISGVGIGASFASCFALGNQNRVRGCIAVSGCFDFKDLEIRKISSPIEIAKQYKESLKDVSIPFMLVHGINDSKFGIKSAREFSSVIRKINGHVCMIEFPVSGHSFISAGNPRSHYVVWDCFNIRLME